MSKFLSTSEFKWIDSKEFELNKYTRNNLKRSAFEVDLEYSKDLQELHDDYLLTL